MPISHPFAVYPEPLGTITTGNERPERLALHLGEFEERGMVWQTNLPNNVWVRGDFGSDKVIDFIGLIGTNATTTTRAKIRLGDTQAEVDGTADYDSGYQTIRTPAITREDGFYNWHWSLPAQQTKRWWRIDVDLHSGDFEAAFLVIGWKREFSNFYNDKSFEFGQEDYGTVGLGRLGVIDKTDGIKLRTLAMDFGWMTDDDRFTKFQPLRDKIGTTGVAYFCFDPDATVQRQDKEYLGWLKAPVAFRASTFKQDRWAAQFNILSMI